MTYKIRGEAEIEVGLGLPRHTTTTRTAYTPPSKGYQVFDTDLDAVFTWNGASWVEAVTSANAATAAQGAKADTALQPTDSIDELADVDTTTAAPTSGQALVWDGSNFVPSDIADGDDYVEKAGDTITGDIVMDNVALVIDHDSSVANNPATANITFATDSTASAILGHNATEGNFTIDGVTDSVSVITAGVSSDISLSTSNGSIVVGAAGDVTIAGATGEDFVVTGYDNITVASTGFEVTVPAIFSGATVSVPTPTLGDHAVNVTYLESELSSLTTSFSGLDDTTINTPVEGHIVAYNGSGNLANRFLVAGDIPDLTATYATAAQGAKADTALQGTSSVDDLADVDTSTSAPTEGQALTWDNTNGVWVPTTLAAGVTELTDLDDVTLTASATGHTLFFDGSVYVNRDIVVADISDFDDSDFVHTSGDETIAGNKTFSDDVIVNGDLTVNGTTTTINSTNTEITDNVITLNDGESGAGVTAGTAGIEIDRGTSDTVSFIFDEADDSWKVGTSGAMVKVATSYQTTFVVADWTTGTPNTLTIEQTTHNIPYAANEVFMVQVYEADGSLVAIDTKVNQTTGAVTISTVGSTFNGRVIITK